MQEVDGSSPSSSTSQTHEKAPQMRGFLVLGTVKAADSSVASQALEPDAVRILMEAGRTPESGAPATRSSTIGPFPPSGRAVR